MTLAFLPIAIPTPPVSAEALDHYMQERGERHYTGCWYEAPICGRVDHEDQLLEGKYRDQAWMKRGEFHDDVVWTSLCEKLMPQVKEHLLMLPLQITYCNLLLQIGQVPAHLDLDHRHQEKFNEPAKLELTAYKWLLTGRDLKSFYVQRDPESEQTRRHIQLPEGHSIFTISEDRAYHGADYIPESKKYILSIFGLVKPDEHEALIAKSIKQFKNFTITV